jgi:hypothetical protein
MTAVACGIEWAEEHHDVAIVGQDGQVLVGERVADDLPGLTRVLELLAGRIAPAAAAGRD